MNDATVRTPDELRRAMARRKDWVCGFEWFRFGDGMATASEFGSDCEAGWLFAKARQDSGIDITGDDSERLCPLLW